MDAKNLFSVLSDFSREVDGELDKHLADMLRLRKQFEKQMQTLLREKKRTVRQRKLGEKTPNPSLIKEADHMCTDETEDSENTLVRGRTRRAAAQAAAEKNSNIVKASMSTKLRRPTNLGEKTSTSTDSTRSNTRRTKAQNLSESPPQLQKKRTCDQSPENAPPKKSLERECIRDTSIVDVVDISKEMTQPICGERVRDPTPTLEEIPIRVTRSSVRKTNGVQTANRADSPVCAKIGESSPKPTSEAELYKSNKVDKEEDKKEEKTEVPTDDKPKALSPSTSKIGQGRVKELVRNLQEVVQVQNTPINKPLAQLRTHLVAKSENGKENSSHKPLFHTLTCEKLSRFTPLATNNRILVATSHLTDSALKSKIIVPMKVIEEAERKRKEEENLKKLKKEEEVTKKREEKLKITREKLRKKREEKTERVNRAREAAEKEKIEHWTKLEKEREEKVQMIKAEKKKEKEELIRKKKLLNQLKAQEAEERRLKEEAARLTKIKEQEEEQKRLAELRLKQQEEAEKLHQLRLLEEQRLKEEMKTKKKEMEKVKAMDAYEMTPPKEDRVPLPPKNENDYGIDDVDADDSSDDESNPKKIVPKWAHRNALQEEAFLEQFYPAELMEAFYACPPDVPPLEDIFGSSTKPRVRTSSAVWLH